MLLSLSLPRRKVNNKFISLKKWNAKRRFEEAEVAKETEELEQVKKQKKSKGKEPIVQDCKLGPNGERFFLVLLPDRERQVWARGSRLARINFDENAWFAAHPEHLARCERKTTEVKKTLRKSESSSSSTAPIPTPPEETKTELCTNYWFTDAPIDATIESENGVGHISTLFPSQVPAASVEKKFTKPIDKELLKMLAKEGTVVIPQDDVIVLKIDGIGRSHNKNVPADTWFSGEKIIAEGKFYQFVIKRQLPPLTGIFENNEALTNICKIDWKYFSTKEVCHLRLMAVRQQTCLSCRRRP